MLENYDKVLEKISKYSGLEKGEIEKKIEAKRAKLSGLISKEGAAQVVAAELGISFDNEKLKIEELLPGMRKVNFVGKVIEISPVREFIKNDRKGKVVNLFLSDETGNIKTILWDLNHIDLIEKNKIKEGDVVEISNASVRGNEVHLGSFSELKLSEEVLGDVCTEKLFREKEINGLGVSDNIKVRAFIVQIFEPKFFNVCPECKKKASIQEGNFFCNTHGKIVPEKRCVINFIIDDGTETIRAVLFNENLKEFGISLENFSEKKDEFLGKELYFLGSVRKNKFFNVNEFIIEKIEEINLDELIEKMGKINH